MLRIIHTADWHLGRIFHGVSLTDDQAFVLEQFVRIVMETKPDAVFISGDIYDRAVPPPLAVKLLNEVITNITLDLHAPVIVIAGNHDSGERLGFGSRLLAKEGLFIFGDYLRPLRPVLIMDKEWSVSARIYALPYCDPAFIRQYLNDESLTNADSAMAALLQTVMCDRQPDELAVCVAHTFIAGAETSESERPLAIGGVSSVDGQIFKNFDYAAMGHLHRAQSAHAESIHYAGSLLKYAFSESGQTKSVNLVEMDYRGVSRIERIPLAPRRDVRVVTGLLKDILQNEADGKSRDDYIMATLLDRGPVLDAMSRIREVYPNCLHIERPALIAPEGTEMKVEPRQARAADADLFHSFFTQTTGGELTGEEALAFAGVAEACSRDRREAP